MTPNVGQGACQAIEDAVVLTKCLQESSNGIAALRAYEERRRARTAAMMNIAWRVGMISQWENPLACGARDVMMKLLWNSVPWKGHIQDVAYEA
jgi:2-polyprenyl-6-methoxyphenol hydroxylase-like FAD-dependent oxidoreductase